MILITKTIKEFFSLSWKNSEHLIGNDSE